MHIFEAFFPNLCPWLEFGSEAQDTDWMLLQNDLFNLFATQQRMSGW